MHKLYKYQVLARYYHAFVRAVLRAAGAHRIGHVLRFSGSGRAQAHALSAGACAIGAFLDLCSSSRKGHVSACKLILSIGCVRAQDLPESRRRQEGVAP